MLNQIKRVFTLLFWLLFRWDIILLFMGIVRKLCMLTYASHRHRYV